MGTQDRRKSKGRRNEPTGQARQTAPKLQSLFHTNFVPRELLPLVSACDALMYACLWYHRGREGCRPGIKQLAKARGIPYRTAQDSVARLKKRKLIEAVQRTKSNGSPTSNDYLFPVPPGMVSEAQYLPSSFRFEKPIGVPRFIDRHPELGDMAKLHYGFLFGRSNSCFCRIAKAEMIETLSCSKSTCKDAIRELVGRRLIQVEIAGGEINVYRILAHPWMIEDMTDLRKTVTGTTRDQLYQWCSEITRINSRGAGISCEGGRNLVREDDSTKMISEEPLKSPLRGDFSFQLPGNGNLPADTDPPSPDPEDPPWAKLHGESFPPGQLLPGDISQADPAVNPPPSPDTITPAPVSPKQSTAAQRRAEAMAHPAWKWLKRLYPDEGDFDDSVVRSFHYRMSEFKFAETLEQIYQLFRLPPDELEEALNGLNPEVMTDRDGDLMKPSLPRTAKEFVRDNRIRQALSKVALRWAIKQPWLRLQRQMRERYEIRYTDNGEPEQFPNAGFPQKPGGLWFPNRIIELQSESHSVTDQLAFISEAKPGWERFWCCLLLLNYSRPSDDSKAIAHFLSEVTQEEIDQLRQDLATSAELYSSHLTQYGSWTRDVDTLLKTVYGITPETRQADRQLFVEEVRRKEALLKEEMANEENL